MIDVLIPSYGRPERAKAVAENVLDNSSHVLWVTFIIEPDQHEQYLRALWDVSSARVRVIPNVGPKNYAGAINTAAFGNDAPYIFCGADDLNFQAGWDTECLWTMDALWNIKVVGTNDLLNTYVLQGWHATHYLIDMSYIRSPGGVVDGIPGQVLHEGYDHNYTDTEFIGTAKARAVFAPCLDSIVEHKHFTVGKAPKDATYDKGYLKIDQDSGLYNARRHLWQNLSR